MVSIIDRKGYQFASASLCCGLEESIMERYTTQWAAQFLVAGELSRQGYKVAMLMGNAPRTDLLAESPKGKSFRVQCKGQKGMNFWLIKEHDEEKDLYYALALVPRDAKKRPRYFIMSSEEVMTEVHSWIKDHPGDKMTGFNWTRALEHEDRWDRLPP